MGNTKNRVGWIDGIRLAACLGIFWSQFHNVFYTYSQTGAEQISAPLMWAIKILYVFLDGEFGVCLFCITGGYLAARHADSTPKELVLNLFTRYLRFAIPLCFSSLTAWLISVSLKYPTAAYGTILENSWLVGFPEQITAASIFQTSFFFKKRIASPLWMLPSLFCGTCMVSIVSFYAKQTKIRKLLLSGLALFFAVIGYWKADSIYIAAVFAGALAANTERKQARKRNYWLLLPCMALLLLAGCGHQKIMTLLFGNRTLPVLLQMNLWWRLFYAFLLFTLLSMLPVRKKETDCRLFRMLRNLAFPVYLLHWPVICSASLIFYGGLRNKLSYSAIYGINLTLTTFLVLALSAVFVLLFGKLDATITAKFRDALSRLITEKEITTEKLQKLSFLAAFFAMLALPLLKTNLEPNKISHAENRYLTEQAELYDEKGNLNTEYFADFEEWFNDNVGYRSQMVLANARIQFHVFNLLSIWNGGMALGPKGELNFVAGFITPEYQHLNLLSEEELEEIASAFQTVSDYLEEKDIPFYYVQNWDKQSIYPEQFPNSIMQYGDVSMTDQIIEKLTSSTTVRVISMKDTMMDGKENYETYSTWGDPLHWTERGAYLGYLKIMDTLNQDSNIPYKVLNESDYSITIIDAGATVFGGIHKENLSEHFEILEPKAYRTDEKLTLYADIDTRNNFWTNDSVDNDTRLLILGDSYFESFLMDDLAESFHETILLWQILMKSELIPVIEEYKPDIVIYEKAEREADFDYVIEAADIINSLR